METNSYSRRPCLVRVRPTRFLNKSHFSDFLEEIIEPNLNLNLLAVIIEFAVCSNSSSNQNLGKVLH
jgi:hypothetical protein